MAMEPHSLKYGNIRTDMYEFMINYQRVMIGLCAFSGVDVISLLEQMGFSETLIQPFRSSSLGDFVIAFLLYKLISPIRYAVTLGGTGYIIRWMRKRGKIPPVTQNTKLSTLYRDSREEIRTKRADFKERRRSRARVKGKKQRGQK